MTAVEKLVQQINRALTEKPDRVTLERLAREYTELCQATSRRLEQCEAMLAAGDHYQVIQLAETTPPVLDQVAFLSFVQADDWLKLCRTSNLPVPVAFPERALARVNELYAKGITAGHPLYRDYRTAMVERNDERALGILRAIIKLNSADESAKAEVQRLEQKVRDQRIASLDQLLQKRDVPAVLAALTGLEAVFREASLTGPVIEQAWAMRREQERQQAHRQCEELIAGLVDLQQARNWQKALESTQTVEKLCNQHGIELEPTLTKQFTVARNWATGIKAQADQEQRYRETLQQFRSLVMAPPTRGHGSIRTALKGELTALTAKRSELEMAGRPLAGELATLATQREARLRQQLAEADRRYLWLVAGGVGLGLVMLASGFFWWNYEQKVAATVAELQQLMTDHNVSGVRQRLDDIRRAAEVNPPPRRVQEMLATLDAFIVQEEQQQADATAKIKGLVAYYNGALTNAPTAEFASKVQEAYAAFSNVAKEFQSGMELQLDLSKQQLKSRQVVENVYAENAIRQQRQQLETLRTEVESSLAQALASTNRWRTIQSRLQAISQNLGQGTALVQTNDVEYQTWLTGFKAKLEPLRVELANLDTASRDLRQAQTAEAYLTALAQLQSTHFSELPEFRAASKVLATSNIAAKGNARTGTAKRSIDGNWCSQISNGIKRHGIASRRDIASRLDWAARS